MERCPHLTPVLRYLWDPGGVFPSSDPQPGGTLLPGEEGPGLCPSVPTNDLVLVAAVPLPAVTDPIVAQSPVEALVREFDYVRVAKTPAVVAIVGMDALPMRNDAPLDCVDECTAWITDNGYRRETIDDMTVYYGSDLCDLDESDWDDPYDIASAEFVDQYHFDVPEGMDRMVFERCGGPYGSEMLEEEGTDLAHMCQTTLDDVLTDTSVLVHEEGVPLVPPVIDQDARRIRDELISQDKRMEKSRYFPCQHVIRRFIVVLWIWDYRMVT